MAFPPTDTRHLPDSPDGYHKILKYVTSSDIPPDDRAHLFRVSAESDFFFFCRYATSARFFVCEQKGCAYFGRHMLDHPFVFQRCRELQAEPDGYLDLWPRAHLKTTIITQYLTLWNFLHRPSDTVAIITWELGEVGNSFVDSLQSEMEPDAVPGTNGARRNQVLAYHWPEIFWQDPKIEADTWKRGALNLKQHPGTKENSISVMSLNAIRTSQHFSILVYDDIVVEVSSNSPENCDDCTEKFKKTTPLRHSAVATRVRGVGTRWAAADTYQWILDEGILKRRPAPEDCYYPPDHELHGKSILHPGSNWLSVWRTSLGESLFAANMRNKPLDSQSIHLFRPEWLLNRQYEGTPEEVAAGANLYFFVDPARPKNTTRTKRTDYTAIVGMALRPDGKRYIIEMIREKMDAKEATSLIFGIDRHWRAEGNPIKYWWWEIRGSSWDMAYWDQAMDREHHRFALLQFEDGQPKDIRIGKLMIPFERGDIILPEYLHREADGGMVNMTQHFIQQEYLRWRPTHGSYNRIGLTARNDDLLDAIAQSESEPVKRLLEVPLGSDPVSFEHYKRARELKRKRRKSGRKTAGERSPWSCMWALALAAGRGHDDIVGGRRGRDVGTQRSRLHAKELAEAWRPHRRPGECLSRRGDEAIKRLTRSPGTRSGTAG